jgi:hypothetical protein
VPFIRWDRQTKSDSWTREEEVDGEEDLFACRLCTLGVQLFPSVGQSHLLNASSRWQDSCFPSILSIRESPLFPEGTPTREIARELIGIHSIHRDAYISGSHWSFGEFRRSCEAEHAMLLNTLRSNLPGKGQLRISRIQSATGQTSSWDADHFGR